MLGAVKGCSLKTGIRWYAVWLSRRMERLSRPEKTVIRWREGMRVSRARDCVDGVR